MVDILLHQILNLDTARNLLLDIHLPGHNDAIVQAVGPSDGLL